MIALQTVTDLQNITSTNNATTVGVLMAFVIAFGFVIVYLFKYIQTMNTEIKVLHKEFNAELKSLNQIVVNLNTQYHDSIKTFADMYKR